MSAGAARKCHQGWGWGTVLKQEVYSLSSGGWKSKLKVLAGWFLLEVPRENLFQAFLLVPAGCWQSSVFLGL